jgi:hypothetical protein
VERILRSPNSRIEPLDTLENQFFFLAPPSGEGERRRFIFGGRFMGREKTRRRGESDSMCENKKGILADAFGY